MSGHSKWSQIKRQKGVADAKRGQAFTKMGVAIAISVREGGGMADPAQNYKLRLMIEKARAINMPKENIERAIERGRGAAKGEGLHEVVYEGFGPGGIALIIEAVTDNPQRTTPEIRSAFEKNGGTMGAPGSVSYQFQKKGLISVRKESHSLDDIFLLAADVGAEDVEEAGEDVIVYTKPEDLAKTKEALTKSGLIVTDMELVRSPMVTVSIGDKDTAEKILSFTEKIENMDDVQKVFANFDIPEAVMNGR